MATTTHTNPSPPTGRDVPNVLAARGLTKRYRSVTALDGLDLDVPQGSIYGLVGRNGAGKTTLIRLVCGLQTPDSGTIELYGASNGDGASMARARRRLGAMIEGPALYPELSAEDNLKTQNRVLGVPDDGNVPALLDLVGLRDSARRRARDLSLGMRQRLGLAVALAGSPDFLVLDEPINGLDPQGIIDMRELIMRLNREQGITILISSHILDELSRLATHYGFIDSGRMVCQMSAGEVERASRKCVRVKVSDIGTLARVLDAQGIEYAILSGSTADVYAHVNVSRLAAALAAQPQPCEILSVDERDESLESFFLTMIGGNGHA